MNLSEKQIDEFLDTLIKIIEDRENVTIDYSVKNRKEVIKNDRNSNNV